MSTAQFDPVRQRVRKEAGQVAIQTYQDIPDTFREFLRSQRELQARRDLEYLHVASVPAVFVHKWLKEGFDAYAAPLKEVVRKIKQEGLDDFLATDKQVA